MKLLLTSYSDIQYNKIQDKNSDERKLLFENLEDYLKNKN